MTHARALTNSQRAVTREAAVNGLFRQRRWARHLRPLIDKIIQAKSTCRILDLGGTPEYWTDRSMLGMDITLLNNRQLDNSSAFRTLIGDGRSLTAFEDCSFDLVHSNSVIEHVGKWIDKKAFAGEVRRLAPAYYLQTPNFWFPFDPHSRAPFLHWLPASARCALSRRVAMGFYPRSRDIDDAMMSAEDASMLDAEQMRYLFPDAELIRERLCGITKSFVVIRTD